MSRFIETLAYPLEETLPNLVRTADCHSGKYDVLQPGVTLLQLHLRALRSEVLAADESTSLMIYRHLTAYSPQVNGKSYQNCQTCNKN